MIRIWLILIGITLWVGCGAPEALNAQESDVSSCAERYAAAVVEALDTCGLSANGTACLAAGSGAVELASGSSAALGDEIPLGDVRAIQLGAGLDADDSWSVAVVRVPDNVDPARFSTLILMGPLRVELDGESSGALGSGFSLVAEPQATCEGLPLPGVLVQSPEQNLALLTINGASVAVNGTAVVRSDGRRLAVDALTRESVLVTEGAVILAGFGGELGLAGAEVAPYDSLEVAHLPLEMLPVLVHAPAPGWAEINERAVFYEDADPNTWTSVRLGAGLRVSALGTDSSGDWVHIQTHDLLVGWVESQVLDLHVTGDLPAYEGPPPDPVRPFGPTYARGITTDSGTNLRGGPGESFPIVSTLEPNAPVSILARDASDRW